MLALAVSAAGDAHAQAAPVGILATHDPPTPPPPPAVEPNFSSPKGIAIHNDGTVFVADTGNHRVWVLNWTGTPLNVFGSEGSGEGELLSPEDVAVRRNASPTNTSVVAVADTGNHRIQVFHANGTPALAFGSEGSGDGNFSSPQGVAISDDLGLIAVADTGNHRIQVFWPNGTFLYKFGSEGSGNMSFSSPEGVAFEDNIIAVADTGNHRVQAFQRDDERFKGFWWTIGSEGSGDGEFKRPRSVDGSFGRLVVADTGNDRVVTTGFGPGPRPFYHEYGSIDGVNFSSPEGGSTGYYRRAYVVDTENDRIHVFRHGTSTHFFSFGQSSADGGPPANGTAAPPAPAPGGNGTAPPPSPPLTVVIEPRALLGPLNFTGAGHAANLTIDVAGLAGPSSPPFDGSALSTVTFPPSETSVATSFATVTFPPGVAAAHVPVDGRLALRVAADVPDDARVQGTLAYEGSGRVALQRVVEVGAASGRIEFDMPVRILLEGQVGGRAFYIDGGEDGETITPIDHACAADDAARVHRHLGGAGECQMDSAGDKIVYTYHLTRFGTVLPERSAPPPAVHTCSVSLGMPDLGMSVRSGERSAAVRQTVINSGSAQFAHVGLAATPWRADLPASATEVGAAGLGGPYAPLAEHGVTVARGLGGGDVEPLWFRLNLAPHGAAAAADLRDGTVIVQHVIYRAECVLP